MKITFIPLIKKWLRRYVMEFSNVLNQETKMIYDTFFRTEQTSEDEEEQ